MRRIRNELLKLFFNGLRFAPLRQKERELARAEDLLRLVRAEGEYPFDFICYKITGFRPTGPDAQEVVNGQELVAALNAFISATNREVAPPMAPGEAVSTVEDLARRFNVATKTIHRWRGRGLRGRLFVFADGRKRLGFAQSAVERFVEENRELVEKAAGFRPVSPGEKEAIMARALAMAEAGVRSRHRIIVRVAAETGRSRETIRGLLVAYDRKAKERSAFRRSAGKLRPREVKAICRARSQGASIRELMEKFDRSRSSVYRIINTRRATELLEREITWVDSVEFTEPARVEAILADRQFAMPAGRDRRGLLTREQETGLFRRYNCLKCEAKRLLGGVDASRFSNRLLRRIEGYMEEADRIKRTIIEANLRLVASVAQRHQSLGAQRADLISEGNFSLMRAVEKFDYTRGYRFSTYASWAIAKDFAKRIPEEAHRPDKGGGDDVAELRDLRVGAADFAAVERAHRSLEEVISGNLTEREQYVVRNHFALEPGPVKRKPKTLRQIGQELGLSSERVRQIELAALQKLRQNLSPEEFGLLTG